MAGKDKKQKFIIIMSILVSIDQMRFKEKMLKTILQNFKTESKMQQNSMNKNYSKIF